MTHDVCGLTPRAIEAPTSGGAEAVGGEVNRGVADAGSVATGCGDHDVWQSMKIARFRDDPYIARVVVAARRLRPDDLIGA